MTGHLLIILNFFKMQTPKKLVKNSSWKLLCLIACLSAGCNKENGKIAETREQAVQRAIQNPEMDSLYMITRYEAKLAVTKALVLQKMLAVPGTTVLEVKLKEAYTKQVQLSEVIRQKFAWIHFTEADVKVIYQALYEKHKPKKMAYRGDGDSTGTDNNGNGDYYGNPESGYDGGYGGYYDNYTPNGDNYHGGDGSGSSDYYGNYDNGGGYDAGNSDNGGGSDVAGSIITGMQNGACMAVANYTNNGCWKVFLWDQFYGLIAGAFSWGNTVNHMRTFIECSIGSQDTYEQCIRK